MCLLKADLFGRFAGFQVSGDDRVAARMESSRQPLTRRACTPWPEIGTSLKRTALIFDMTRPRKTRAEKAALEKKRASEATAAMAEYEATKRAERQKTARLKAPVSYTHLTLPTNREV